MAKKVTATPKTKQKKVAKKKMTKAEIRKKLNDPKTSVKERTALAEELYRGIKF